MKTIKFITLAVFLIFSSFSYSQIIVKVKPKILRPKPAVVVCNAQSKRVVVYTTNEPRYRYVKGHWTIKHGRKVWVKARYVRF